MLPKKSFEQVLQFTPYWSDKMADAIQLWSDMYEGHSPWLREPDLSLGRYERVVSLGLPQLISSEKARMAVLEMKSEISAPAEESKELEDMTNTLNRPEAQPAVGSGNSTGAVSTSAMMAEPNPTGPAQRADFLNKQYKKVLKQIRRQLEYGIAKGGLVIKPYVVFYKDMQTDADAAGTRPDEAPASENSFSNESLLRNATSAGASAKNKRTLPNSEMEFDYVQADRFYPLTFDSNGQVIEAAFVQTKLDKARERVYLRLEHHKLENHVATIRNLAFESTDMELASSNSLRYVTDLGDPISLKAVPEWAGLEPETKIQNVDRLMFAYFKMPEANTVDPYSPLGVSGYSRVIQLIKDADEQYSRMLWEFEGSELAVDVDRNALAFYETPDYTGSMPPNKQDRLFRKVDLNAEDTYQVFSPTIRDESIIHGLNIILQRIEDACSLSRGTLSEVTSVEAKTATELKILKQRSYATNADIQAALQAALEDLVYVMDAYCDLYELTPEGKYEVSFEWDDSIIIDSESELSKRITLMQNGLASKLETRMWYFGETENQARLALQQVDLEAEQAAQQKANAERIMAQVTGEVSNDASAGTNKGPSDTTEKKISTGQQADNLDKPNKSQDAASLRNDEK